MAEEQGGLSYTIRFIPDTTAIDASITEIAKRVEEEVGQAIRKARVAAGVEEGVPAGVAPIEGVGVVDRILSEFNSVKERITGMMRRYGILAGEAIALRHPADKTLGAVVERIREKLTVTRPEDLSEDMRLQIAGAMTVVAQRIKAMRELRPDLSKEEATEMAMREQVTALKGIVGEEGLKQYATMRAAVKALWLADYYKRPLAEVGDAAERTIERGLMESFSHKLIAEVGKARLRAEGQEPIWEAEELTWKEFYRRWGATEEQVKEWGIPKGIRVMDFVRLVREGFEFVEFGAEKTGRDISRDIGMAHRFLEKAKETLKMREKIEAATGRPIEDISGKGILMTAGIHGAVEAVVKAEETELLSTMTIDLADDMRAIFKEMIPDEIQDSVSITAILDGIHNILERLGSSPTRLAQAGEPAEGYEGDMFDISKGG